ncbi:hypothetical protein SARC_01154 [Sphaeroforma arctica JP610]|uniref:Cationic amino acid transporter C-terminal domain-containing protein n=1 Tax=Sphaeroforma arctica JP610 TaxID=667725 RepID=A0A0L0GCE9_9EUKA|nr:hypothetical protein SARC_01154 [Sphaeroforma arctica JP610]KNC86685.1 hypothetical protein SARC_01154 [Sphaeroforma arctica JP610]|eukprot:XP_014160587.1 hypothetical protein SARC_01154 [Sphaeroforma arctica JP610]
MEIFAKMGRKKPMHIIKAQELSREEDDSVKLSLFDLLCIGVGCTVGSGVFVLTGDVLTVAGPSAVVSWLLAGLVCLMSGFSYMELSSRVPTSGSTYAYSYFALGEAMAMIGAVCLTLEYGISAAGVARSWSSKLIETIESYTDADLDVLHFWYTDPDTADMDAYFDVLAVVVMGLSTVVLAFGLNMGKIVINLFTVAKVCLVAFMVIAGFAAWPSTGYGTEAYSSTDEFLPYGIGGMLLGTSKLFFGFIGFDEVACLAGRANNPRKTMPLAIGGTLLLATIISGLAQASLSGMIVPCDSHPDWNEQNPDAVQCSTSPSFADAFRLIGWSWAAAIVSFGEAILLPIVVLLAFIAQPEMMAAMAVDGMLPSIFAKENSKGNLTMGTIISGTAMSIIAGCVPFDILWDMISLGVLVSFCLTNSALICTRLSGPEGNNKITGCLIFIWAASFSGEYMLWKGYFEGYFDSGVDNSTLNDAVLYGAIALIAATLLVAIGMTFMFKEVEESKAETGRVFYAPLVPLLPVVGINLNFFLMAQISWINLAYLAIVIAVSLVWYLVYGIGHSAREFDDDMPALDHTNRSSQSSQARRSSQSSQARRSSRRQSQYLAESLKAHHKDEEINESTVELAEDLEPDSK